MGSAKSEGIGPGFFVEFRKRPPRQSAAAGLSLRSAQTGTDIFGVGVLERDRVHVGQDPFKVLF